MYMEKKCTTTAKMRKVFGLLVTSLGSAVGGRVFDAYCKQYGVRMDDPAPDAVILDAFTKYGRF